MVRSVESLRVHVTDLKTEIGEQMATFWSNFDARPVGFPLHWPPTSPEEPTWQQWHRLVPTSTFDDPVRDTEAPDRSPATIRDNVVRLRRRTKDYGPGATGS